MVGKLVKRFPYSGTIVLFNEHDKEYPYLMTEDYQLLVPDNPGDLKEGMLVRIKDLTSTRYTNRQRAISDAEWEEAQVLKCLIEDYTKGMW